MRGEMSVEEIDEIMKRHGYKLLIATVRKKPKEDKRATYYVTIPLHIVRELNLQSGDVVEIWIKVRGR